MGEARKNLGECFASKLSRGCPDKIDMRVGEQQTHQLFAGVTGSADNGYPGLSAAEDSGLYSFFHNAQCVFALNLIATKHCRGRKNFALT